VRVRISRSLWPSNVLTVSGPGYTRAELTPDGEVVNASLPISIIVGREDG
jgi:hypothetical protein